MPEDKPKKPQLHQSSISLLLRCGYKFSRVILDGDREPQTTPLVIGTGTHSTNAQNLQNKIDRGILLPREAVTDYARDNFIRAWNETAVVLNEEEMFHGLQKSKDMAMDQTIECSKAYHYECAPKIEPVSVEQKFVIEAQGYAFDFAGAIDVCELKKTPDGSWGDIPIQGDIIRDTKTRKTNLGQQEVDRSNQYTFYALYKWLESGKVKVPDFVAQDSIIKGTKNRAAFCVTNYSRRTTDDFAAAFRIFNQACKIIKAGVFAPASPMDYLCNHEYCGFYADGSCPYVNSKSRGSAPQPKPKENENGKSKQDIIAGLTTAIKRDDG